MILSHFQARALRQAHAAALSATSASLDLGLSTTQVQLNAEGVTLPDGSLLSWEAVDQILTTENGCFRVEGGALNKVQIFSEETNRLYTLFPTIGAPTMLISGIPMHRIKDTDPAKDTLTKIKAAGPIRDHVLDTCTGLGYTALEAAKRAERVTTVELDPVVHEIIRENPWSRHLFTTPNITPLIGDVTELIAEFPDASFACVIHDPPMFTLAGDLYSLEFYGQLLRVLRPRGRLFHYIGNPDSKSGATVTRGVLRRLQEAGFTRVTTRPEAFGVIGVRP